MDDNDRRTSTGGGTGASDPGTGGEEVAYGGGYQQGGGMVEPEEFPDGGSDAGLPNDALAEGLGDQARNQAGGERQERPEDLGTVDPNAAPPNNDTGDRIGDVAGFQGSDQVVEDPGAGEPRDAGS